MPNLSPPSAPTNCSLKTTLLANAFGSTPSSPCAIYGTLSPQKKRTSNLRPYSPNAARLRNPGLSSGSSGPIFGVDQSVVSRRIRNAFRDDEIDEKSNMQKMHIAKSDPPVALYSLDVILSVGYRANSKAAVAFRRLATKILREHLTKGYTVNRRQIAKNYNAFMKAAGDVQNLLPERARRLRPRCTASWQSFGGGRNSLLALLARCPIASLGELKTSRMEAERGGGRQRCLFGGVRAIRALI